MHMQNQEQLEQLRRNSLVTARLGKVLKQQKFIISNKGLSGQ